MGRLPHDDQSQRALGLDFSGRAFVQVSQDRCRRSPPAPMRIAPRSRSRRARRPASPPARLALTEEALCPSQIHAHGIEIRPRARSRREAGRRCERRRPDRDPALGRQRQCADDGGRCAAGSARACRRMSDKANTVLQAAADKPADAEAPAEPGAAASDQLNDVDRALQQPVRADSAVATTQGGRTGLGLQSRRMRTPTTVPPGQDLADRKDLHRLRRPADDGVGRAHVHGVTIGASDAGAPASGIRSRPT